MTHMRIQGTNTRRMRITTWHLAHTNTLFLAGRCHSTNSPIICWMTKDRMTTKTFRILMTRSRMTRICLRVPCITTDNYDVSEG